MKKKKDDGYQYFQEMTLEGLVDITVSNKLKGDKKKVKRVPTETSTFISV